MLALHICDSAAPLCPASPCSSLHILSHLVSLVMVYLDLPIFVFEVKTKQNRGGLSSSMRQPRDSKGWTGTSAASVFLEVGDFQKIHSSVKWETNSAHLWNRPRTAQLVKTVARKLYFPGGSCRPPLPQPYNCPSLPCSSAYKVRVAMSRWLIALEPPQCRGNGGQEEMSVI